MSAEHWFMVWQEAVSWASEECADIHRAGLSLSRELRHMGLVRRTSPAFAREVRDMGTALAVKAMADRIGRREGA